MEFNQLLSELRTHPKCLEMKDYIQHGSMNTYDHCISVAKLSYRIHKKFHIRCDESQLVRGAFLHDFYLYDWHHHEGRWHGYKHPHIALEQANKYFEISEKEANIISSHMWPLTLFHMPKSREAVIVCIADKVCSMKETLVR